MTQQHTASRIQGHQPAPERAGLQQERLERKVLAACDAVGEFIEYWGFKGVYGRIWCLLALSRYPLTQADIARRLDISRSLVSGAVGELVDLGLIRATDDSRNAPYEAVIDVWPTIADVLRSREWMLIEAARIRLEAALEEAELLDSTREPHPWRADRLRFLLRMTEIAQQLLRILIALRTPRSIQDLKNWGSGVRNLFDHLRQFI
ncbi:MAG: MarR family transcriptional regulator [Candidatus Dadabacteria bacterium]|nr:MAG: MarR family transcriptional regulator [Candidatus Dadabacteria bacterium]